MRNDLYPGIVALLGPTSVGNPLLGRTLRLKVRRVGRFIVFDGMAGAHIGIYTTNGRKLFVGKAATEDFRWSTGTYREPLVVRITRQGIVETVRLAPVF